MKNVQISYDLFLKLAKFHIGGLKFLSEEIRRELNEKLESIVRRDLYTKYKQAESKEAKATAWNEYVTYCRESGYSLEDKIGA